MDEFHNDLKIVHIGTRLQWIVEHHRHPIQPGKSLEDVAAGETDPGATSNISPSVLHGAVTVHLQVIKVFLLKMIIMSQVTLKLALLYLSIEVVYSTNTSIIAIEGGEDPNVNITSTLRLC